MKSITYVDEESKEENKVLIEALNERNINLINKLCLENSAFLELALKKIIANDDVNTFQSILRTEISHLVLNKQLNCGNLAGRVSLLHFCAANDASNICKVLLDNDFSPNQWNLQNTETPMLAAARCGSLSCMKIMFERGGHLINRIQDYSTSILLAATKANQKLAVLHIIDEYGSLLPENLYLIALYIAVERDFDDIAKILINCGTPVQSFMVDSTKTTLLHMAVENYNQLITKNLMEAGADSNQPNFTGQVPLHLAAREGNLNIMKLLVDHGADVNKQDKEGRSPIHYVINSKEKNKLDTLKFLVSSHADINLADKNGTTPLHLASFNRLTNIIDFLISSKAELCAVNKAGYTAIYFALKYYPNSINALVERLDSGIYMEPYSHYSERSHQIYLNFMVLKPLASQNGEVRLFTELNKFSNEIGNNNVLKKILLHPLSEGYLRLKWSQIKWLYYVIILFLHIVFSSIYVIYAILIFKELCPIPLNSTSSFIICQENRMESHVKRLYLKLAYICGLLLMFMIIFYIVKEITHLKQLKIMYFHYRKYEHWINLLIIASVPLITCNIYVRSDRNTIILHRYQYNVAIVGTFLTWFMQMLLLSNLPKYGLFIEMLKTVSCTVFHFFVAYSPLLFGFGFSFYILFPWYQTFNCNIPTMFLKVLVMMIGEIDFEGLYETSGVILNQDIEHTLHTPYIYPAFILIGSFIVFISIIIMNLLFGLAVADIQKLMKTVQLHQLVQHVELITYMENILCCPIFKRFPKVITDILQNAVRGEGGMYKHFTTINVLDPTDYTLPSNLKEKLIQKSSIRKCNEQELKNSSITENFEKLAKQVVSMQKVVKGFKSSFMSHQTMASSVSNASILNASIKRRKSIH